jgi:hypothetical protein
VLKIDIFNSLLIFYFYSEFMGGGARYMVSPSAGAVEQCVRNHTVHYKGTNNIHICLSSQTYMKSYVISFYSNCTIFRSYMFRTQNTGQVPGFVLEQVGPGKYF